MDALHNLSDSNSNTDKCCFDFLRLAPMAFLLSTLLIVASLLLVTLRGFHWGIDFTGGLALEVQLSRVVAPEALQVACQQAGFSQVQIQPLDNNQNLLIRIAPSSSIAHETLGKQIITLLQQQFDPQATLQRLEWLGAQAGGELTRSGLFALTAAMGATLLYVAVRFEWRLATSAVLALTHDLIITLGLLSLLSITLDLILIAALLSVIGYSLNDTIVVFDRIRENCRQNPQRPIGQIINLSLTQTLGRTLITSTTTFIVVLALFYFGGILLQSFSLVLLVGIAVGTFSSIYIASALALKLGLRSQHLLLPTLDTE